VNGLGADARDAEKDAPPVLESSDIAVATASGLPEMAG
jgi:hypothetical protein